MEAFLESAVVLGAIVITGGSVLMMCNAAYRNGVRDGWGFSRDPECPGYALAGYQIKQEDPHGHAKFMKDRESHCIVYSSKFTIPPIPQDVDESLQCPPDLM